jgi:hypothetical protein
MATVSKRGLDHATTSYRAFGSVPVNKGAAQVGSDINLIWTFVGIGSPVARSFGVD